MTQQGKLFSEYPIIDAMRKPTANEQKVKYKKLAADKVPEHLSRAREIARSLAAVHGSVNIEEVREVYEQMYGPWNLGNGTGSVFDVGFVSCGVETAKREKSHGRLIRRWRLE